MNAVPQRRFGMPRQEVALILITVFWGGSFLIVHRAMAVSGPLFFVGLRFGCAAIVTALLAAPVLRGITRLELKAGFFVGLTIYLGYVLQTWGLQTILSSKSAFITSLYVPIVPLLQWLVLRRMPGIMAWVGVALAFIGMILMADPGDAVGGGLGLGEWLTIISTIAIAAEIILIGGYAERVDARRVTVIQVGVASLLAFATMPFFDEAVPAFSRLLFFSAVGLGIASAVIQFTMNWAQKQVSPTKASVIYAGEPVWAGIIGRMAGEHLPPLALLGGASIALGVIVSELKPRRSRTAD
ncbi:MAG: EamA family transporter [Rhizorhabdus sp.]|nr:EamA family transporter [Rhizorhabdus sp.]